MNATPPNHATPHQSSIFIQTSGNIKDTEWPRISSNGPKMDLANIGTLYIKLLTYSLNLALVIDSPTFFLRVQWSSGRGLPSALRGLRRHCLNSKRKPKPNYTLNSTLAKHKTYLYPINQPLANYNHKPIPTRLDHINLCPTPHHNPTLTLP